MRQETTNIFSEGLNFDLNPLTTPNNVLTDAVNSTFITFNGDELALQNDAGNIKIQYTIGETTHTVQLSEGFYPLGIKEYGGVLYIISGKLPDTPASSIPNYVEGQYYTAGSIVYNPTSKLYFEKKISGSESLPIQESNDYWNIIGDESAYNNYYGFVEIGSYPSPEASDKRLFDGDTVIYDNTATSTIYRWYPTGVVSCVIGPDLKNTGYQNVEEKYQSSDDGVTWVDIITEPYRTSVYYNPTACPIPFNWAGISVDSTAYNIPTEVEIPYAENTVISVQTPIKSGFNYVFLSIPQNKTLLVKDSMNNNITSSFTVVGTDDRPTHAVNKIYKKSDAFATDISTTLYIIIS